jgi:hypothetical protein
MILVIVDFYDCNVTFFKNVHLSFPNNFYSTSRDNKLL